MWFSLRETLDRKRQIVAESEFAITLQIFTKGNDTILYYSNLGTELIAVMVFAGFIQVQTICSMLGKSRLLENSFYCCLRLHKAITEVLASMPTTLPIKMPVVADGFNRSLLRLQIDQHSVQCEGNSRWDCALLGKEHWTSCLARWSTQKVRRLHLAVDKEPIVALFDSWYIAKFGSIWFR